MGGQISSITRTGTTKYTEELNQYEEARYTNEDVKKSDDNTNQIMKALSRSVSLEDLKKLTLFLCQSEEKVANFLLQGKNDIWKNEDWFNLVQYFFDSSLETLKFYGILEKCLMKAEDDQFVMEKALDEIRLDIPSPSRKTQYKKILKALENFKRAGNIFSDDLFEHLNSVHKLHTSQKQMLDKKLKHIKTWNNTSTVISVATVVMVMTTSQKQMLDKKLRHIKTWNNISSVIFVATVLMMMTWSVVVILSSDKEKAPIEDIGEWIDFLHQLYAIRGQQDFSWESSIVDAMKKGSTKTLHELNTINNIVEHLQNHLNSFLTSVETETDVLLYMDKLRMEQQLFLERIKSLSNAVSHYRTKIIQARELVINKIRRCMCYF